LNVQWSTLLREAKNQATRTVLVFWIVFDNHTTGDCLLQLLYADFAKDALVNRVF